MRSWVYWVNSRAKKLDMLRSVWFANLDCLVDNIKYLHDDSDEHQQPNEPYFTDQSNKSELGDKSADQSNHICTSHTNRTCNCTGDCDDYDRGDALPKWDYVKIRKSIWESNQFGKTKYYDDIGYRQGSNSKG
mgnify:FL=1